MNYYYDCADGRQKLNFNRYSWKWINYDTPKIYDTNGDLIVEAVIDSNGLGIYIYEDELYKNIEAWIIRSDRAFHNHFRDEKWIESLIDITKENFR